MPERWTVHEVLARAPDAKVAAAARRLAAAPVWSATGATDTVVFGHCQGTAKDPYAVTVDLGGPRFRCTCPSASSEASGEPAVSWQQLRQANRRPIAAACNEAACLRSAG